MTQNPIDLRPEWFTTNLGVERTGIYEWSIWSNDKTKIATYIVQTGNFSKRLDRYTRNLRRMINGLPYHIRSRTYRAIHEALLKAYENRRSVTFTVLEIVTATKNQLNERERNWIATRRREENKGAEIVLNEITAAGLARVLELI